MDKNHQDNTESKLTATEDKSTPSLSSQDQQETDRLQNNQIEDTIKQLRDRGYSVTEEYSNTGQLSKVSGEQPQRKTWWDWLQLLIIPLLIFFLGIGFTWVQNQTSLQIAKDNRAQDLQIAKDTQEEETLKAYLDDMTTLLLDKKLVSQNKADKPARDEAAIIARAKTLTELSRLTDGRRKGRLLIFLHEAQLIGFFNGKNNYPLSSIIDLNGADLSGAYLFGADLSGADLSGAILSKANLIFADLNGANLSKANLRGADFTLAHLRGADFFDTDFSKAILTGTDLNNATDLTQDQLDQATCTDTDEFLPKGFTCHHKPQIQSTPKSG